MAAVGGWADDRTAEAYGAFCRKHAMYAETSKDVVRLAAIGGDQMVVDLACGTGQTTEMVLSQLGPGGSVRSVDSSPAMLRVAQAAVRDSRVTWHEAKAESLAEIVSDADAVVCNSAIWQTDMPSTFAAVHASLRPGGRFVCNVGRQFLMLPFTDEELNPTSASLHDLVHAIAVLEHGHVPRPTGRGRLLTVDGVAAQLRDAGFDVVDTPELRYDDTIERQCDWLRIPIFTERNFPDLTIEQRNAAVESAYQRVDKAPTKSRWIAFVADKPR
jgi:ubiquinone/menaquinone biosynthesis C-methylase UbiE